MSARSIAMKIKGIIEVKRTVMVTLVVVVSPDGKDSVELSIVL